MRRGIHLNTSVAISASTLCTVPRRRHVSWQPSECPCRLLPSLWPAPPSSRSSGGQLLPLRLRSRQACIHTVPDHYALKFRKHATPAPRSSSMIANYVGSPVGCRSSDNFELSAQWKRGSGASGIDVMRPCRDVVSVGLDCVAFDPFHFQQDGLTMSEVDLAAATCQQPDLAKDTEPRNYRSRQVDHHVGIRMRKGSHEGQFVHDRPAGVSR